MRKVMTVARQFRDDENGAALIEYTVLLGIMIAAVVTTIIAVGTWINGKWTAFNGAINP
jgi:pilus assembly protein Flp/PilA